MEVCRLSSIGDVVVTQPLSIPLKDSVRFFQDVMPASLSAFLTVGFPRGRITGLPRSIYLPEWVRYCLFTDDRYVCDRKRASSCSDHVPVGLSLSAFLAYSP